MNIDPDDAAERSARLAEKIKQAMGEGWTQLPGLAGIEKPFEYIDDNVFLTARNYLFYERPDGQLKGPIAGSEPGRPLILHGAPATARGLRACGGHIPQLANRLRWGC